MDISNGKAGKTSSQIYVQIDISSCRCIYRIQLLHRLNDVMSRFPTIGMEVQLVECLNWGWKLLCDACRSIFVGTWMVLLKEVTLGSGTLGDPIDGSHPRQRDFDDPTDGSHPRQRDLGGPIDESHPRQRTWMVLLTEVTLGSLLHDSWDSLAPWTLCCTHSFEDYLMVSIREDSFGSCRFF